MQTTKIFLFFFALCVLTPNNSYTTVMPHNATYTVQPKPNAKRLSIRTLWKAMRTAKSEGRSFMIWGGVTVLVSMLLVAIALPLTFKDDGSNTPQLDNRANGCLAIMLIMVASVGLVCGLIFIIIGLIAYFSKPKKDKQIG